MLSAWRYERHGRALGFGRPPEHDLREIMNAILYVDRTGVQWRYLPHDFPNWNTVYGYFAKWQSDGIFTQLNGLLRELVRQQEGRNAKPSACVIDAQSVKTSTSVPATRQGTDNAKKIVGRKRSIVTDTLGLSSRCWSPPPACRTPWPAPNCSTRWPPTSPASARAWVDGGYRKHFVEHAATLGIDMEITARTPGTRGFTPIPKRWVVERSIGWIMMHRRLARDYETLPARSESHDPPGHDRPHGPPPHRREHRLLARPGKCESTTHHWMKQWEKAILRKSSFRHTARVPGAPPQARTQQTSLRCRSR